MKAEIKRELKQILFICLGALSLTIGIVLGFYLAVHYPNEGKPFFAFLAFVFFAAIAGVMWLIAWFYKEDRPSYGGGTYGTVRPDSPEARGVR